MKLFALLSPALVAATLAFSAPVGAAPSVPAGVGDPAGLVQPVSAGGWRCVKQGDCWVACRGDVCRRACYPSRHSCQRSL